LCHMWAILCSSAGLHACAAAAAAHIISVFHLARPNHLTPQVVCKFAAAVTDTTRVPQHLLSLTGEQRQATVAGSWFISSACQLPGLQNRQNMAASSSVAAAAA
jgi:hypothetical protein